MSPSPAPYIYTSHHAAPPIPAVSLWTYLFPSAPSASTLAPSVTAGTSPAPALIDGADGRTLSRAQLRDAAAGLADSLGRLGLGPGDTACVFGMNALDWVVAALACVKAGVVVSPANYAYTPKDLAHQLSDSDARLVFVQPALVPVLEQALALLAHPIPPERIVLLSAHDDGAFRALPSLISPTSRTATASAAAAAEPAPSDVAFLCYSSGTTGLPKGVQTTHGNMVAQLQAFNVAYQPLAPDHDVVLGVLPFSHIYGLTVVALQPLTKGVSVVVLPRWEEASALTAIQKYKITHGLVVPPMLLAMLHSPNMHKYDVSSLRSCQSGAAPLGADLCAAFEARFPTCKVTQGYGLTETSPVISVMTASEATGRKGTIGRLIPTYEARLVDVDTGLDVAPGRDSAGELWVRGPSVMKGYHENAKATDDVMVNGWFKTGDVAVRDDDGYFTIVDRAKELIKYKGFQVPPAELEALLLTHPHVVDAGVIGVPSAARATELPRAYVVLSPALAPAERAAAPRNIARWVNERVARHKRLAGGVRVLDAVPKSPSGKILRKELRALAKAEGESEGEGEGEGEHAHVHGGRREGGLVLAKL
ncbi:4-coumarate--CoA ligase-like 5 [Cryptotrichosporon argae]